MLVNELRSAAKRGSGMNELSRGIVHNHLQTSKQGGEESKKGDGLVVH